MRIENVLGRGSTADISQGSTLPRNLKEQLAVQQAAANPTVGTVLPIRMADPRWPASEGWVKMQQIVKTSDGPINIHYVRNTITDKLMILKLKLVYHKSEYESYSYKRKFSKLPSNIIRYWVYK